LDQVLYKLTSQWRIEPTQMAGKREQLFVLLVEVGSRRFKDAIQRTIETHTGDFCPTIATIRGNVGNIVLSERKWYRNPECPRCHGTGWFDVPDRDANGIYGSEGHRMLSRCHEPGCVVRKEN
jgi:hypothetical protein